MNSYTLVSEDKATHRLVQNVVGKGEREAIVEYGEALCDSCDAVIAKEGETLSIGHKCWRCGTEVIRFDPIDR